LVSFSPAGGFEEIGIEPQAGDNTDMAANRGEQLKSGEAAVEAFRCCCGPLLIERRNRDYTLYHAGPVGLAARLRYQQGRTIVSKFATGRSGRSDGSLVALSDARSVD
jgi:hypothetical protein